ncbi:hypothetical protein GHT06_011398 [Daphnia sinensis]|uniref:Helicase c-terminal domain containing protein n=1 Tax=Daphnia sinensis TaxID=1820382 RepID=A0AAD5LKU2_9CRUS|nr:hypothetical protein GHT06_011398 [Daphnia sinensis]
MDLFPKTMDGKKCPEVSNTPTPKSLNNSDDVIKHIRSWIQQLDTKSKMHEDAVKHIESFVDRQISCLESTVVERQYVKVVLEMWLRKSLRKAIDYLNDETIDISVEMPTLLKELSSINSFEDIGLKLKEAACQLTNLCDPGCQYLQLILDQVDLFKNTLRFSVLVASYFKQFKASCIDKVFSRCLDDVGKDQTNGKRNRELIVTLNALLQVASKDVGIQNVLEKSFAGKDVKDFDDANGKDLINQLVEIFESCSVTSKNESSEWFNELKSEKEWEPKLQTLVKEMCKAFLLPKTTIEVKDEYGRKILFIKGVSVFISKMMGEMKRLKEGNTEVQEIQIVGLSSVHVDCHLDNKTWHGTNVGIVADTIFVDYDVCRSGQQQSVQGKETSKTLGTKEFVDNFFVCWDVSGKNGEPGQSGKSGGNVHVICNKMIDSKRWKIIANGGDGSDGQNGSNGESKADRKTRKWTKEYFNQVFPSMSTFETGEQTDDKVPKDAVQAVLTNLKKLLPGEDIKPNYQDKWFVSGTARDGSTIEVSYYKSKTKKHTLILCKGSRSGQGGFGGTVVFEFMTDRKSFAKESSVPVVGEDNRQPRSVRMGVYQAMGWDGKIGAPVGDVAFVHSLDTSEESAFENLTGKHIGFENDVSLRMKYHRKKPTRTPNDNYYAKFPLTGEYASIVTEGVSVYGKSSHFLMVEAIKKKAIVRQSLVQHFFQVDERKQMTQSLHEKLSSDWEEQTLTKNVDFLVNQMEDKETQLYQLTSQCSRGLENIGSTRFVKPASKKKLDVNIVLDTSHTFVGQRSVGRRPVDFRQIPPVSVRCLDILPTTSGGDSAIHSIFGQMNSNGLYECNNVKMFRHRLASYIRQNATDPSCVEESSIPFETADTIRLKENRAKVFAFVKEFVLRVQKRNALDYPLANEVQVAYFEFRRTNSEDIEFNWENATEYQKLYEEYAKFVETLSNTLQSAEVEMLAVIHGITIYVYSDQSSSFKYKATLNSNISNKHKRYILYLGNGEWQRVEPNIMMENFCKKIDDDMFECEPIGSHYFCKFFQSLEKHNVHQQYVTSMKLLNPENGETPDKLFELLLKSIQENEESAGENLNVELIDKYSSDFGWLAEQIEGHNCRNLSPIFYLNIIKKNPPNKWRCEFLMLEIYDRFTQETSDILAIDEIRNVLNLIANGMPYLMPELRKAVITSHSCSALQPQNLLQLLKIIAKNCGQTDGITSQEWSELQLLPISDWYYHLRSKIWETKVDLLLSNSSTPKENKKLKKEAVYMLLELEFKNDEGFCNDLLKDVQDLNTVLISLRNVLHPGATSSHKHVERNVDDIITEMKENVSKNDKLAEMYPTMLDNVKEKVKKSKKQLNEYGQQECTLTGKRIKTLIKQWQTEGLKLNDTSVVDFLYVYDYAVQKTCTKKGGQEIRLRDTQRVAIMTLLTSKEKNTLTQNIDVITSNDILARRDSTLSVADGGLRDLYEYFSVSVANNCSHSDDERTQAYNAAVVYGQLANFQRDYLLDKFYGHNIRGDRTMDLIIIDEVDCMLLDLGNNTLYLSHDIPEMEMLESLYVFIWEKMRSASTESDKMALIKSIKSAVLRDLYGALTKDDLESIHGPLKDKPSEKNALWDHLIETKVIDPQGRLLMEDKIEGINFNQQMDPKIIFYLRGVAKREKNIQIPGHLMSFVDCHLDTWLENAILALELKRDEDYVVDQDRTDTSPDLNPQVIIIDQETGMDQTSSQWDGALHQFIQLKEGCKLALQSLKAIFVANAMYLKTYKTVAGISGTLGSGTERQFMQTSYKNYQFVIPTAFQKQAQQIILPENQAKARSLVIFCQSIKDVNIIHCYLKNALRSKLNCNHLHCYTRDYEKFAFEGESLEVGHVIVATNLAGRGTDIKISDALRDNGGLHVCLTFLPKNERIEEQAMGRSARNGAPGSGVFILYEDSLNQTGKKWAAGKWFSMKQERQWRESQRISRLQEDFKTMEYERDLFEEWSIYYTELNQELKNKKRGGQEIKTICKSVLDIWALWLDQTEEHLKVAHSSHVESLRNFRAGLGLPENNMDDHSWMTPVRSTDMAKHLSVQKSSLSEAGEILKRIIDSKDSELYPAAHYYFAFVLIQEGFQENKTKFIQILQKCETILSNDIEKHLSFYRKVALATPDQAPSFCVIDAYKQQKDNIVKILEYFIGSVRALLGSHYCSVSNLIEAGKEEKKEKNFLKKAETFLQNKRLEFARSCSLGKNDLMRANIISDSEQGSVLKALIDQKVIDANGELSSNYQKFSYSECPAYEEPVMRVIGRIFVAEIVKRQWLRAAQDANCLKAINLLPLKPYRDLLGDLMAAHVISGARVTEDAKLIEKETQEIEDEDERECVRKFLKSRQAVYASRMKKSEIFLDLIERDIRKIPNTVNISTELYTFDLAAFNHVIDIKDAKSSWKTYFGATFAGAVGIASIGVGIFLIHGKMLSFGFSKNLLLMGGASDILYAITTILTHSKFTWADYTRQRLRSAMGKTEPIEMIKTIYKLCDSSENADFRKTINLAIGLERWKRQQGGQINKIHETLLGRSVKQVGLINHQTEFHFHMQLHYLLQDFSSFILRKTKKCVTKNFTEIRKALTQFNELHGLKTSQDFVREKLNQLISHWAAEGQKWVCAIIDETTLKLNEIAGTGGVPLTQEIADKGIRLMESIFNYYEVRMKLVRVTVTCIREFLLGLENHANPEDPIAKNIDVEEFKLFQKKMMADIDSELERQVAKILGILRQRIHQVTSDQISSLANVNSEMYTTLLH